MRPRDPLLGGGRVFGSLGQLQSRSQTSTRALASTQNPATVACIGTAIGSKIRKPGSIKIRTAQRPRELTHLSSRRVSSLPQPPTYGRQHPDTHPSHHPPPHPPPHRPTPPP